MEIPRAPYRSTPLIQGKQTIRLLQLGRENGLIYGSLKVIDLGDSETESWQALSYCWNPVPNQTQDKDQDQSSKQEQRSIQLGGVELPVLENLWLALSHLLDLTDMCESGPYMEQQVPCVDPTSTESKLFLSDSQYYWIDAICIDQSAISERNHQVDLMGKIFSKAKGVIAWLGVPDPRLVTKDEWGLGRNLQTVISGRLPQPRQFYFPVELLEITQNPYWYRMWIIQEVVLARELRFLWGHLWIGEEELLQTRRQQWFPGMSGTMHALLTQRQQYQQSICLQGKEWPYSQCGSNQGSRQSGNMLNHSLVELLYQNINAKCQDRRDKVYALLGLLPPDYPIKADYSMSMEDLFMDLIHVDQHNTAVDWGLILKLLDFTREERELLELYTEYYDEAGDATILQTHRRAFTSVEFRRWLEAWHHARKSTTDGVLIEADQKRQTMDSCD